MFLYLKQKIRQQWVKQKTPKDDDELGSLLSFVAH